MSIQHSFKYLSFKRISWFLSGFFLFFWLVYTKNLLVNLVGNVESPGGVIPFIGVLALLGSVPGLRIYGRGLFFKKIFVALPVFFTLLLLSYLSYLQLSDKNIYFFYFRYFWLTTALFSFTTIALFLLFTGRRQGWQFRLFGAIVASFPVSYLPKEHFTAVLHYTLIFYFLIVLLYIFWSLRVSPMQGVFHSKIKEYRSKLPLQLHLMVSTNRAFVATLLAFALVLSSIPWTRVFLFGGSGAVLGWITAYYTSKIRLRHLIIIFPVIFLGIAYLSGSLIFVTESTIASELALALAVFLATFLDRLVLGKIRTKLRYFYWGFFSFLFLLPVLYHFQTDFAYDYLWLVILFFPFILLLFVLRDTKRLVFNLILLILVFFQWNLFTPFFQTPVVQKQSVDLTCFLPSLENTSSLWVSPDKEFLFYKKAKIKVLHSLVSKSLIAVNFKDKGSWLEFIRSEESKVGRKGKEYIQNMLHKNFPVLIVLKHNNNLSSKIDGVKYKDFLQCRYYYNDRSSAVFNDFWKLVSESYSKNNTSLKNLFSNLDFKNLKKKKITLKKNLKYYQDNLLEQLFSKCKYLYKEKDWKNLEQLIDRNIQTLSGLPGFLSFLEKFYTSFQKESKLLEILLDNLKKDKNNEELILRIARIYASRGNIKKSKEFAGRISEKSHNYKKARLLIVETKIASAKEKDALLIIKKLIKAYPEDNSLKFQQSKILSIIEMKRFQSDRTRKMELEAKRKY